MPEEPPDGRNDDEASLWDRLDAIPDIDSHGAPDPLAENPTGVVQPPPDPPAASGATADPTSVQDQGQPTRVVATTPDSAPRDPRQYQVPATFEPARAPLPSPDGTSEAERWEQRRRKPRTRRRRRLLWTLFGFLVFFGLIIAAGLIGAWYMWSKVDKIDLAGSLTADGAGVVNYLIVGTDSRAEIDETLVSDADAIGLDVTGSRSDTLLVLHIDDGGNRMMSIPRDLMVDYPDGTRDRVNAALVFGGPPLLVDVVESNLDLPIHHYIEVDLAGFLGVVEAVGGVTMDIPAAACDPKSGLDIRTPGVQELDPETALAYVRSRTFTTFDPASAAGLTCDEIIAAGLGTVQPTADLGRVERQREFLTEVFDQVGNSRNPLTLLRALSGMSGGLRVDDTMSMWDAMSLARRMGGLSAETETLGPTTPQTIDGKAVLVLDLAAARTLLDQYRD